MNGGGAEKVTLLLANELCARGWTVTIIMSRLEGPYLSRLNGDIKIIALKNRKISRNILELAKFLKSNKPAILYSSMMYVNVIAGIAAKLSGFKGKLVFSEHSHVSTAMITNRSFTTKLIFELAKLVYKRANAVICVSEGVKKDITSIIKNIKKAIVIYNPIEDLSLPEGIPKNLKYRIISIGRLDRDKNFKLLIQVFAEVLNEVENSENYELYILGEGYERANLEKLITDLNLKGKVFLPGFIDSPGQMLNHSELFVFTSVSEGFANVLVEALSCGLPVISTDCKSGPAEILKYGEIGRLVPINDLEGLKNAILEEITLPNKYSNRTERIIRSRDFSISKIADKYESVFEDLSI